MKAMTLKEYCELHKIAKTTLLFHLEKLNFPPLSTISLKIISLSVTTYTSSNKPVAFVLS